MKKKFLELPIHHKIFFLTIALTMLSVGTFAGIFYAQKAFTSPAPSFRLDPFHTKGETSGIGTHFTVIDSEYLNITLGSTETVDLKLTSIPKVITMMFEQSTSTATTTEIILSGLEKNTIYYKYEDDYHHLAQFTTDNDGTYTYTQNISTRHFVFIQTRKSTKFISDTGGDCTTIGTWNQSTKTCTLTQDISETVQIDGDGVTLDGNEHALLIAPAYSMIGINIPSRKNTTIKNFHISGAYYGVFIYGTGDFDNIIEYNALSNNMVGIYLMDFANSNKIRNNTATGNASRGIYVGSSDNSVIDNILQENTLEDLSIGYDEYACRNTITGNIGSGGFPIGFFNTATILDGGTFSELIFCNADNSNIQNVTTKVAENNKNSLFLINRVSDSIFKNIAISKGGGLDLFFSDHNEIDGATIDANSKNLGMYLYEANNNTIRNSTVSNSLQYGIYGVLSSGNNFFNNNFINNYAQVYFDPDSNGNIFNFPKPVGGNYWNDYDTPAEGCDDQNSDSFCDAPYVIYGGQDNLPWTTQDGWKGNANPPTLTNATTTEDDFLQDSKGVADKTNFTFSLVYTDPSSATTSPQVRLALTGPNGSNSLAITRDTSTTTPTELHDGDFANGELFARTMTFPKGNYTYHYEANGGAVRFPATGELTFTTGYSNVAFLPGHPGSRLYRPGLTPVTENQLWYPNTRDDMVKLRLNATSGESIDTEIYTKDAIDEVAYTENIYLTFFEHMDGDADVKYKIFPYDWRKDQKDTANQLVLIGKNGEFYSMIDRIEEMANTSPTGKVSIIAHSNGGLVAKELINTLKTQHKELQIEKLIMVATPQLGTPEAILQLLHGVDYSGIPNPELTRELGENMKSAYTLLPSREYFNRTGTPISRPIIEFATTTSVTKRFRDVYGNSISDYDTLRKFMSGENGVRSEPIPINTNEPNVLKENFIANAEARHSELDLWTAPANIQVIQIIGFGLDTLRGILYDTSSPCKGICPPEDFNDLTPKLPDDGGLITTEGDETVTYVSAGAMNGEKYWVNIKDYNESGFFHSTINRSHKNILELEPLQALITTLLKNESTSTLPQFITSTRPQITDADMRLRVGVFSPVTLHLYDDLGRHTGLAPNPDPSSDLEYLEEQIPNSYYWQIGEGQYGGMGAEATTTIVLKGKETGTFTMSIQEVVGETTATTSRFVNIPTTASTTATVLAGGGATSILAVDFDGNGTIDAELPPNDGEVMSDPLSYLTLLKKMILSFTLQKQTEKQLLNDVEQIERTLERFIKYDNKEKKNFEKLTQKNRNKKLCERWKEWRRNHHKYRDKNEDKLLLNAIENTEKDISKLLKQKKISASQADILFTALGELKTLVK